MVEIRRASSASSTTAAMFLAVVAGDRRRRTIIAVHPFFPLIADVQRRGSAAAVVEQRDHFVGRGAASTMLQWGIDENCKTEKSVFIYGKWNADTASMCFMDSFLDKMKILPLLH